MNISINGVNLSYLVAMSIVLAAFGVYMVYRATSDRKKQNERLKEIQEKLATRETKT